MSRNRRPSPSKNPSQVWLWGLHACRAALQNPNRHCFRLLMTPAAAQELYPKDFEISGRHPSGEPEERILIRDRGRAPKGNAPESRKMKGIQEPLPSKVIMLEAAALTALLPEGAVHQGIAMEVAPLAEPPFPSSKVESGILVVLDHITDPHNVGAIIRTARALGALGILMTERHAPPLGGVVAKAASGALESLPVWKVVNLARTLDELKKQGFWTLGLEERAPVVLSSLELPPKVALIVGAEGEGLRRLTQEKCDFLAKLPTDIAFSTLNVSVATALALYELVRVPIFPPCHSRESRDPGK